MNKFIKIQDIILNCSVIEGIELENSTIRVNIIDNDRDHYAFEFERPFQAEDVFTKIASQLRV